MYPRNYNPDSSCPYGCDFDCGHFSDDLDERSPHDDPPQFNPLVDSVDDDMPYNWPKDPYLGYADAYPGPSDDPSVWVTKSGSRLRLADMTDLHLARSLACCIGHDGIMHVRAKTMLAELMRRSTPPQEAPHTPTCSLVCETSIR